ncbi:MAG: Riboflavin synthase [Acidobacteriota bacterium]|jgi:riboflavin synthase|nr:riboflavin synthase subunit alpha [Acidobacteriota bacterium]
MFTGLIRELGSLQGREKRKEGARLEIAASPALLLRATVGSSVCVNGVCLTSTYVDEESWIAELSDETLQKTTLGTLRIGTSLHLEPSLRLGEPLDGHSVSGHVDGLGHVLERSDGEGLWKFSMPIFISAMTAPKGSITVDGISLTVVECGLDWFTVSLIPETLRQTALKDYRLNQQINLEADPIGRYIAHALAMRNTLSS